jgi:hypothetical protein
MKTLLTVVFAVMLTSACWGQSGIIVIDKSATIDAGYVAIVHVQNEGGQYMIVCLHQYPDCRRLTAGHSFPVQFLTADDERSYPFTDKTTASMLIHGTLSNSRPFKVVYALVKK